MSQRERHAQESRIKLNKLDKAIMLRRLASLKGSSPRRPALARAVFIAVLAISHSVAAATDINTKQIEVIEKPSYDIMDVKLYLHNKLDNWQQFECANWLGIKESNWRYDAVNKSSGAYGIFQHMSDYAKYWDPYKQIDKHIEYIDTHRVYKGDWCLALSHLERFGWH